MHFTVLVAGENPTEQLAPFQENNMNDCPREFLAFNDKEDEFQHDYDNEGTEFVKTVDGRILSKRDSEFLRKSENGFSNEYFIPEGAELVTVPFKQMYSTFEEYVQKEEGFNVRDEEENRYGYWSNPNSYWDWYQLGGRWRGLLKAKPGVVGVDGESGVFDNGGREGYYDQLRKKDIDFEGMIADERKMSAELFAKLTEVVAGRALPDRWEDMVAKHDGNVQAAREEYNNHPVVVSLRENNLLPFMQSLNDFVCDMNEEKFIQTAVKGVFRTHSMLVEGEWKEEENFGSKDEWEKYFNDTLAELPDDTLISIYDCHI
jgi:hypothetical protein